MTDSQVLQLPLPDARARERIAGDLDTNLLVEAGAGSGKTTALVGRMAALVASGGATVDEIAAVTFTRKAAGELRERFQARLEADIAAADPDSETLTRLRAGLDEIDRAFIGTIHAFCARLLRERPLEVGLDPAFEEIPVEERLSFRRRWWDAYLERRTREADPALGELAAAGLRAAQLFGLFDRLVENPDVHFPADESVAPSAAEVTAVRAELDALTSLGMELMPDRQPTKGWDSTQKKLRTLSFTREVTGWKEPADFFEALEILGKPGSRNHSITYNRWKDKDLTKDFEDRLNPFSVGPDAPANRVLHRWYAHRYGLALDLCRRAADEFAEYRRRAGRLDFQDLLLLTARLLRTRPDTRADLGLRYRRLLVDEFQDTDPLQAEIMLLLASDPWDGAEGDEAPPPDWRTARPRPGALFVVGDPKQSIYRFRRADILLYERVKERFEDFGDVVELTANFRSRPPIGDLVNELFDAPDFFPPAATAHQARFEPLNTRPTERETDTEGVFWYGVEPDRTSRGGVTRDDAERLATWIADRVRGGARTPGDFMILTRTTHYLSAYARALEARGVPIQVTGAGVGVEEELTELLALLECMIDPGNPVKVVAVLVGLFFGLDLDRLTDHRLDGGSLDAMRPGDAGDPEVLEAVRTLHGWWRLSTRTPADVFVGRMVADLGLLPYAAAGDLGSLRAGALVFAMDAVRAATLAGDASLPGALDALRGALDLREAEAPLEPARPDVVRLMNLHQAKGLEAPVVILADPSRLNEPTPDIHVARNDDGSAVGYLCVFERTEGFARNRLLARPLAWEEKAAEEALFSAAESVRLLYVAATRARDELVVARWPDKADGSSWSALDPWLDARATRLPLEARDPEPREPLDLAPDDARRRVDEAEERVRTMSVPSFRHVAVTEVAKAADLADGAPDAVEPPEVTDQGGRFRGYSWGSVVHAALAVAAEDPDETALLAACRSLLLEHDRPVDDLGDPIEATELLALVQSVRTSELWRRATSADRLLAEVPFAATGTTRPPPPPRPETIQRRSATSRERRQLDLFGGARESGEPTEEVPEAPVEPATPSVLEGVIDLAFREGDGWVIADYKTDVGTDPDFGRRLISYRRQVDLYADAWSRLTGEPVKERILFFTSQGTMETW